MSQLISKFRSKGKGFKIIVAIIAIIMIVGGYFAWRADSLLRKISSGGLLSTLVHSLPGVNNQLKGESDGRVNILLLGMRGANDPNGGLLSDTIQLLSIDTKDNKMALMSVPRDLYVDNPAVGYKTKLNAVYAYGEQKGSGQGIKYMEQEVGVITGLPIQYGIALNYDAFTQFVNAIGGVQITLDKPFEESVQFNQPHVCDSFFNVPTGQYQTKTKKIYDKITGRLARTRVVAQYPLCTAPANTEECGGDFKLPAGSQTLTAQQAMCYARSRETSNDFERAKRQQQIIKAVESQLLSAGTLTNFSKINGILDSLGNNVKTDMQGWEMKRLFDLYAKLKSAPLYQRVMDTSNDPQVGLLYGVQDPQAGDILLPKGDNYNQIQALFKNIFTMTPDYTSTGTVPQSAANSSGAAATGSQQTSSGQTSASGTASGNASAAPQATPEQ